MLLGIIPLCHSRFTKYSDKHEKVWYKAYYSRDYKHLTYIKFILLEV